MRIRSQFAGAAALAWLALSSFAVAAGAATDPSFDQARLTEQALANVRERLHLTEEQVARVRPILGDHLARMRGLFADYTAAGLPALMQEIRAARARFQSSLEPILTPEQMKEVLVIRQEVDQQIKDLVCDQRVAGLKQPLSLTAEQEASVRPILCEDFERKRELMALQTAPTGGPAARYSVAPEVRKIQAETEERLRQVLTADQMKAYEAYREEMRRKAGGDDEGAGGGR
jgi:predicted outer membrane protein